MTNETREQRSAKTGVQESTMSSKPKDEPKQPTSREKAGETSTDNPNVDTDHIRSLHPDKD